MTMSVEAALQEVQETLDMERSQHEKDLEQANIDRYQHPYRIELVAERHCCECGDSIAVGKPTVVCDVPLHLGMTHAGYDQTSFVSQFIAWCDRCWSQNFGEAGVAIKQMLIGEKITELVEDKVS